MAKGGATARKMVIALSALMATRPTFGSSSARRSAWSARLAGVLLAPTASLAAARPAAARPAGRGSVVPFSHEFTRTRRKLGYVMDNDSIRTARDAWLADATAAEATYGHISTWDVSGVTDMSYLFCARHPWMEGNSEFNGCQLPQSASSFNADISAWDISGVTNMYRIFRSTSDFDQDLGWCVDPAVLAPGGGETVESVHESSCESTMCGIVVSDSRDGVMDDSNIRTAVAAWLADATAAEAAYSHISTWETSGVTDMGSLFCANVEGGCNTAAASFNEDIGAWDTSGVANCVEIGIATPSSRRRVDGTRRKILTMGGGGGAKGTPAYMAPELLESNTFTEETDVYAYALVIWEVLTGDIPWRGLNPMQVGMQILNKQARPAVPEGAPADLVALMQRCWAHEPGARPKFAAIKAELLGSGPETPAK